MNVYGRLKIIDELAKRAIEAIEAVWPGAGGIKDNYTITFYEDDEEGKSVGITFEIVDYDLVPELKIFTEIQKKTGADDILLTVEDDIVTAIELYFSEKEVSGE